MFSYSAYSDNQLLVHQKVGGHFCVQTYVDIEVGPDCKLSLTGMALKGKMSILHTSHQGEYQNNPLITLLTNISVSQLFWSLYNFLAMLMTLAHMQQLS